jgi:hypothetical protein
MGSSALFHIKERDKIAIIPAMVSSAHRMVVILSLSP